MALPSSVHIVGAMIIFLTEEFVMRLFRLTALSIAAVATLGASAAMARPAHHKPHKVCKIVRSHGHAKKVCRWVR